MGGRGVELGTTTVHHVWRLLSRFRLPFHCRYSRSGFRPQIEIAPMYVKTTLFMRNHISRFRPESEEKKEALEIVDLRPPLVDF